MPIEVAHRDNSNYILLPIDRARISSERPVYVHLNTFDVIRPSSESRLRPDSHNIAQREVTDKFPITSLGPSAQFREPLRAQRIDVVLPRPHDLVGCKLPSCSLVTLYGQLGRRMEFVMECFLVGLKGWINGSRGVHWKVWSWYLVDLAERGTATGLLINGAFSG